MTDFIWACAFGPKFKPDVKAVYIEVKSILVNAGHFWVVFAGVNIGMTAIITHGVDVVSIHMADHALLDVNWESVALFVRLAHA